MAPPSARARAAWCRCASSATVTWNPRAVAFWYPRRAEALPSTRGGVARWGDGGDGARREEAGVAVVDGGVPPRPSVVARVLSSVALEVLFGAAASRAGAYVGEVSMNGQDYSSDEVRLGCHAAACARASDDPPGDRTSFRL